MIKLNSMFMGFLIGVLGPMLAFIIFCAIAFPEVSVWQQFLNYKKMSMLSIAIRLSVLANLGLFFIFLKVNKEKAARGILGATILYAIFVVIFYFL